MRRTLSLFVLAGCIGLSGVVLAQEAEAELQATSAPSTSLEGLDEYVADVMQKWKVPGLAIAVVKDGEVIVLKGYGYRDLDKKLPVTSKTLFAIASVTKSFTVTTLRLLADEGKLAWDKPGRAYLPSFPLYHAVA